MGARMSRKAFEEVFFFFFFLVPIIRPNRKACVWIEWYASHLAWAYEALER